MTDTESITATLLDYFEGWFTADTTRMQRALHPDLAKRGRGADGEIVHLTASWMIEATGKGQGKAQKPADPAIQIRITEIHENIATAIVHSALYIEYAHLVRTAEGWKILNTLWVRVDRS
jgi:hypothetical protein